MRVLTLIFIAFYSLQRASGQRATVEASAPMVCAHTRLLNAGPCFFRLNIVSRSVRSIRWHSHHRFLRIRTANVRTAIVCCR